MLVKDVIMLFLLPIGMQTNANFKPFLSISLNLQEHVLGYIVYLNDKRYLKNGKQKR